MALWNLNKSVNVRHLCLCKNKNKFMIFLRGVAVYVKNYLSESCFSIQKILSKYKKLKYNK